MSPKELLYIEDALGHEQHLQTKCQTTAGQLQDKELKAFIEQPQTRPPSAVRSILSVGVKEEAPWMTSV